MGEVRRARRPDGRTAARRPSAWRRAVLGACVALTLGLLSACQFVQPLLKLVPQEEDPVVVLGHPFGRTIEGWTLAQAFGTVRDSQLTATTDETTDGEGGEADDAAMGEGAIPGERWVTTLNHASVHPIGPGEVVYTGRIERGAAKPQHFVVVRHIGDFVIPQAINPSLRLSVTPEHWNPYGSFSLGLGPTARSVYGGLETSPHAFDRGPRFNYPSDRVNTIYSVYLGLDELKVFRGRRVGADSLLGTVAVDADTGYASLQLEIRHPRIKTDSNHESGFRAYLGPSGNGRFKDAQVMVDLGYRSPSDVILANALAPPIRQTTPAEATGTRP